MNRRDSFRGLFAGMATLSLGGISLANPIDIEVVPESILPTPIKELSKVKPEVPDIDYLQFLKLHCDNIRCIRNPSIELQLVAVRHNADSIKFIRNPCEKVIVAAIEKDACCIRHLEPDDLSEELKSLAISFRPSVISYLENPSDDLKWLAIRKDPDAVFYVKDATEEMRIHAIEQKPKIAYGLARIGGLSQAERLVAVKLNDLFLADAHLGEWDDEVEAAAIAQNPKIMDFLAYSCVDFTAPVAEYQCQLVRDTIVPDICRLMDKIGTPCEAAALLAVEKNWRCIGYIQDTTQKVIELANKKKKEQHEELIRMVKSI